MVAMTAFVGVIGRLLGGKVGLIIALMVAFGMRIYSCWSCDKAELRKLGPPASGAQMRRAQQLQNTWPWG